MPFKKEFLPLINFLQDAALSAESIEFAIEMRGLFRRRGEEFEHLSASSKDARHIVDFVHAYEIAWMNTPEERKRLEEDPRGQLYGWTSLWKPNFEFLEPLRTSKLRVISYFLDKSEPEPHAALAAEIEANGVWGLDKNDQLRRYSSDSRQAQDALTSISLRMEADADMDHPYWHDVYCESDVSGAYGWPVDRLPNFRCDEEFGWSPSFHRLQSRAALFREELYTIGRLLLMHKATPATIMTAIERHHVYGYDRFGKLKIFSHSDDALVDLTSGLARYAGILLSGVEPDACLLEDTAYCRFGWPKEKLPDFAAIESEPIPEPPLPSTELRTVAARAVSVDPDLNPKSEKAYLVAIGALLGFIRGDLGEGRHPGYQSQQQLIDLIHAQDLPGARDSSLKKKFAAANKLLGELGFTFDEPPAGRTGTG